MSFIAFPLVLSLDRLYPAICLFFDFSNSSFEKSGFFNWSAKRPITIFVSSDKNFPLKPTLACPLKKLRRAPADSSFSLISNLDMFVVP